MDAEYISQVVTRPEARGRCFALRAAEYARYYSNIPAGSFSDEFDEASTVGGAPASQLIAVESRSEIVGTCRLLISRRPAEPGLRSEIDELAEVPWAGLASEAGIEPDALAVGEIGKFAVSPDADVRRVKWMLLTKAGEVAAGAGLDVVIALMPPLVERAARHAGVRFGAVEGGAIRRGTPPAMRLLLRYHRYFLPTIGKLGMEVNTAHLDAAEPETLEMLLIGLKDGPRLWAIPSAELASAPYPPEVSR